MRIGLFLLFLFLVGCSTAPERNIASEESIIKIGEIDVKQSQIRIFPAVNDQDRPKYYFYLQLRDEQGFYVDCDPSEIVLKNAKGKKIKFELERLFAGRYYLILGRSGGLTREQINFFVQGKRIRENFKLNLNRPDPKFTKITLKKNARNKITFKLRLADKSNRAVEIPDRPEIVLDGQGTLKGLKYIGQGVWEFSVIYPEDNQIMYFSVRAMGVRIPNLYRYQHVEK